MPHRPPAPRNRGTWGTRIVSHATEALGSVPAIVAATALILVWLVGLMVVPDGLGNQPYQMLLNTLTCIVTFLMVFVIQSSQNRDTRAMQVKLDAQHRMLRAMADRLDVDDADDLLGMMGLEHSSEQEISRRQRQVHSARRPDRSRPGRGAEAG